MIHEITTVTSTQLSAELFQLFQHQFDQCFCRTPLRCLFSFSVALRSRCHAHFAAVRALFVGRWVASMILTAWLHQAMQIGFAYLKMGLEPSQDFSKIF